MDTFFVPVQHGSFGYQKVDIGCKVLDRRHQTLTQVAVFTKVAGMPYPFSVSLYQQHVAIIGGMAAEERCDAYIAHLDGTWGCMGVGALPCVEIFQTLQDGIVIWNYRIGPFL